jgi:putative hemolysin
VEQCRAFDELFTDIASKSGAVCAYVNRAFEYAIENTDIRLWGDDNAHTSDEGAYLAVCVHFATIFGKSATLLGENVIENVKILQEIADKIVFGG